MGVFNNYAIVPADKFMPVDVHVPGCPPRPEALMHGIFKLRQKIMNDPAEGWRERYEAIGTQEIVRRTPVDPLDRGAARAKADQAVNVFKPGTPPVPDATGLELLAADLRTTGPDAVLDTEFFRDKAALHVAPAAIGDTLEFLRGRGSRSSPPCTASTTTPRSRASACSTRCST